MQNSEGVTLQRLLTGTAGAGCVFRLVTTLQHCSTSPHSADTFHSDIFLVGPAAGGGAIHPSVYRARTFPGMVNTEH